MGIAHYVKVLGSWQYARVPAHHVKSLGAWRTAIEPAIHVKVQGRWRTIADEAPPPTGPGPGTYTLSPSSLFLSTSTQATNYAEFVTSEYRGSIINIWAVVSWRDRGVAITDQAFNIAGRPNGNYYRNIANNGGEYNGRTISHQINTFDASSLSDFNSGAAYGFNMTTTQGLGMKNTVANVQLKLQIS